MTQCVQPGPFFSYRKSRRERVLRKMAAMRAAKDRKRTERAAAGLLEREPRMQRYYPFEYGVRVKATGETHWRNLVSARQSGKALGLIVKYCT